MTKSALALALAAAGSLAVVTGAPASAQAVTDDAELASDNIASGETTTAIATLEIEREQFPNDPALLINLGIAYAHMGKDAKARDMFKAALKSDDPVELETANGKTTDSRRLARKALAMLERGDFRVATSRVAQRD